jgi:hypothetical protein
VFYVSGNEQLHVLTTNTPPLELRIDLGDFDRNIRFASYSDFSVADSADMYRLSIGEYSGSAGMP